MATPDLMPAVLWAALVLGVALGALVLAVGPRRRINQLVALVFALSGVNTFFFGDWAGLEDRREIVAFNGLGAFVLNLAYLFLIAQVLDTPLVAPLRKRAVRAFVVGLAVVAFAPFLTAWSRLARSPSGASSDPAYEALSPTLAMGFVILLYALAASIAAWRRAPRGSPSRTRAAHFAIAFGVRDILVLGAIVATIAVPPDVLDWGGLLWPAAIIFSVPLLAYGILRTQLFDIDLRLKAGLRRGTVLTVFLGTFGVLAIVVERVTTAELGVAAGGVGVVLLLIGLAPLQRWAGRVADRMLPQVRADDAYVAQRKLDVYRGAVEDALAQGPSAIDADSFLTDLRKVLGITGEQHELFVLALRPRRRAMVAEGFEVIRELGRGGFGIALLARDRVLDRRVVLKQPLGLVAASVSSRETILREARIASQIHHPNVVGVHQVLADRDPPVLVLEYVEGESLAQRLDRVGPLSLGAVKAIGADVLAGLDRIHRAGVVHRDLKPSNILIAQDGTSKITDFGIARAGTEQAAHVVVIEDPAGSPAYMSPEQRRGGPVDARSDLYSLGVVLCEATTGTTAFADATRHDGNASSPSRTLPLDWTAFIDRAVRRDPAERFTSAADMADALEGLVIKDPAREAP